MILEDEELVGILRIPNHCIFQKGQNVLLGFIHILLYNGTVLPSGIFAFIPVYTPILSGMTLYRTIALGMPQSAKSGSRI